jgi:hypothetical protein
MLVHSMKDDQNQDASLAVRFPESALSLLDRVVPQHQTHGYYELRAVLDLMISAAPTLRQDGRWRRLDTLV